MEIPAEALDTRDREALFEQFFRTHHLDVLAFALRRADQATAHDATAETFAIAWRRWDDLPTSHPLPWLYGVARRVLANARRGARRQDAVVRQLVRVGSYSEEPRTGELIAALAELSERDREALLLLAWEGLSTREASTALGITHSAFRVRAHRARRRLRQALGWEQRDKKRADLIETASIRTKEQENA